MTKVKTKFHVQIGNPHISSALVKAHVICIDEPEKWDAGDIVTNFTFMLKSAKVIQSMHLFYRKTFIMMARQFSATKLHFRTSIKYE